MNVLQLLNGLTFAALLFVVASGFTLIFGLLRIVNLAHGALYLLGGYIGFTVAVWSRQLRPRRRRRPSSRSRSPDSCSPRGCCASCAATSCGRCC